jgi:hypothetical protein
MINYQSVCCYIQALCFVAFFSGTSLAETTYYVSDVSGNDSNAGTELAPFKTIQAAANVMQSGDVCLIKQGVYRETVVPPVGAVTFKNFPGDYVLVTGTDVVQGWSKHSGLIFKAPVAEQVTQLFVGGKLMNWARHPNETDGDRLSKKDMMTVQMVPINGDSVIGTANVPDLEPRPKDFWKGGYVVGVSDDIPWWSSLRGKIDSSDGNALTCSDISFLWYKSANSFGKGYGTGYIIGAFNALDATSEWVWQDGELFYQPELGTEMDDLIVEARTRTVAFDLSDKSGITLEGLHIKAANILLPDSTDCVVRNCTVKYPGVFSTYFLEDYDTRQRAAWGDYEYSGAGISVGGHRNIIENCYVGHTWTTGISMYGNSNIARNNLVEEANWMGERMSLISSIGDDNQLLNNTLRRCGRDGIEMGHAEFNLKDTKTPIDGEEVTGYAKRAKVSHNYVRDVAYFSPDSGYLYVNHTKGFYAGRNPLANSEISYNIFDGYHSPVYYSGHGGIYLDNGSSGYTIHHNVVMNSVAGVHINNLKLSHRPNHVFIYNNTFIDSNEPVHLNNQVTDNLADTQVVAINNMSTHANAHFEATEKSKNIKISTADLVDIAGFDFQLVEGAAAIDAGVEIDGGTWPEGIDGVTGITDGFLGSAPDIGAFEYGAEPWEAGAELSMPVLVDELGFLGKLMRGEALVQSEVDAAVAAEEAAQAKIDAQKWQTTNSDKWLLTDFTALNQATKDSLGSAGGGMAYRQILDLTPGVPHRARFEYRLSNKDNKTGAGVRVSVHEGTLTEQNYASLGSKNVTTNADTSEPEEGEAVIEFTPTENAVYVVFHKIGHSSQTSKVRVGRLEVEQFEQAPQLEKVDGGDRVSIFSLSGAQDGAAQYVSTVNGVTMTLTPESDDSPSSTIGFNGGHIGVTGGVNKQTVNTGERLHIEFDQAVLFQSMDVGAIVSNEVVHLASSDFDGLSELTGVEAYDDSLDRISQVGGDFIGLGHAESASGILLQAENPMVMSVDQDGSVSYKGITVRSLDLGEVSISENVALGTALVRVEATDVNSQDRLSFAITGGNTSGAFAIDSDSGELTVQGRLDYETTAFYSLTIRVSDDSEGGLSDTGVLRVAIADVVHEKSYARFIEEKYFGRPRSGPTEHMDGDGVPNFVEYALGMDLEKDDRSGLPQGKKKTSTPMFEYSFKRAHNSVRYVLESTADLTDWENAIVEWDSDLRPNELVDEGGMQHVEIPLLDEDHRFFRLRVMEL